MKKLVTLILAIAIAQSLMPSAFAADAKTLDSAVNDAAAYMLKTVAKPEVGSVGGEWAVIGLARSGYDVPATYFETYYKTVEKYVKDCKGVLHDKKYTEYSRVILGLTAAGFDPRNVGGYDLTAPLEDFDKTIWQGINGSIWALIALDSGNYASSQRDNYIAEILSKQLSDGGWNLSGSSADGESSADPDMTGMALQALARYSDREKVKTAIDKALKLKFTYKTSEGVVQMLVATATLGKSTNALVDELLKYRNSNGSFNHVLGSDDGNNQMATEQALYGLVAAQRARDGKSALYDMADTAKSEIDESGKTIIGLPGKHADVTVMPIINKGKTFPDITYHANKSAILALAERDIISGSGGLFNPGGKMTRAEYATIAVRSLGLAASITSVFSDIPSGIWYEGYVNSAYSYGIISGIGNNKFNPSGQITRQEAAVLTANAAKLCGFDTARSAVEIRDTLAQFGDYTTSADWSRSALAFCYSEGILDEADFDIRPKDAVTRAEIAEMLYRLLDRAELLK